jgi:uncharacterized protein YndB with AHSA1/START domain
MDKNLVALASIKINAPAARVWAALVDPQAIKQYMFGTKVVTEWREGTPIVWKGEWQGRQYEDKGIILKFEPETRLQYSHFSPLSGASDLPENYHIVTVELLPEGERTRVTLAQDNNATVEEQEHSKQNWNMMLADLKKYLEQQ